MLQLLNARAARPGGPTVGAVDDLHEREAERVADAVIQMPGSEAIASQQPARPGREGEASQLRRASSTLPARSTGREAPASVREALRSPGHALDASTRAYFEPRFGCDFRDVRVHSDARAARSAKEVGARAYTVGRDIVVGPDESAAGTSHGRRLLAHELAHVVQQGGASGSGAMLQRLPAFPPRPGPNGELPVDPFQPFLEEEEREARRRPRPVVPGDRYQQEDVIEELSQGALVRLWESDKIHAEMQAIADDTEARETAMQSGRPGPHTAAALMPYWQDRFVASMRYILEVRGEPHATVIEGLRAKLAEQEKALQKSLQGDALVAEVTRLRADFAQRWQAKIDEAAEGFVRLARNESRMLTRGTKPKPAFVTGLPLGFEPEVMAKDAKEQVEAGATVSASVVRFVARVQQESRLKVKAENYLNHEQSNPHAEPKSIGKFSFDIHMPFKADPNTGFYDPAKMLEFFNAVERASKATDIEWNAYYNDASVVIAFNNAVGIGRVAFSGGGGGGRFHHGPTPYILHVHFNIMPRDLAAKYTGMKQAKAAFDAFIARLGLMF